MPEHKPQIPIPNRLKGLVALITGAAGNIGLEAASRLLHEGASVVLVDINAEKLAQSKRKLIDDFKESPMYTDQFMADDAIFTVQADVTVEEDVLKSVTKTVSKFGRLNIAVLCAGIRIPPRVFWKRMLNSMIRSCGLILGLVGLPLLLKIIGILD
jgi:NAD(P)-dependent dehydrogenase (short-subunit alcohol dehydrogenase family)